MNKIDNIIWLKCTEYWGKWCAVVKDKKGKHLIYNGGSGQLKLRLRNEKDSVMWRILRVGIWRSIPVNEAGMCRGPGAGQNLLYLRNWKKRVRMEQRGQEIKLERFWGSRLGKSWIHREEFGLYMNSSGKHLRGFKLESDVTWCTFFKRSPLVVQWRIGC